MTLAIRPASEACRWLMLIYQLPTQPAYPRTKVWRRLQALGAIAVRGSAYVLPLTEEAREDFHWLVGEIVTGGGDAMVCEARLVEGLADAEVEAMFNAARDEAYAELAGEARQLLAAVEPGTGAIARLRRRLETQTAIDFFGAAGREPALRLIETLERKPALPASGEEASGIPADLLGRTWVTREQMFVDRLACAWAVKRFIDPAARFRFVSARGYRPEPGDLRFDMFEGEISHEGDKCSFEVLIERARLDSDPALRAIAKIVHDIDLKDEKFGRPEAAGILLLLKGVCAPERSDEQRLARASAIFNDLYESVVGGHA